MEVTSWLSSLPMVRDASMIHRLSRTSIVGKPLKAVLIMREATSDTKVLSLLISTSLLFASPPSWIPSLPWPG